MPVASRARSLVVAVALFAAPAVAQSTSTVDDPTTASTQRRTVIDFDAEVIDGVRVGPDGARVVAKPKARFKSTIRLRADFRRELMASATAL